MLHTLEDIEAGWEPLPVDADTPDGIAEVIEYRIEGGDPEDTHAYPYHTALKGLIRTLAKHPGEVGVISMPKNRSWARRYIEHEHRAFLLPEHPTISTDNESEKVSIATQATVTLGGNFNSNPHFRHEPILLGRFELDQVRGIGLPVVPHEHKQPIELTLGTQKIIRWLIAKGDVEDHLDLPQVGGLQNVIRVAAKRGLVDEKLLGRLAKKAAAKLAEFEPRAKELNEDYDHTAARVKQYEEEGATKAAVRLAKELSYDVSAESREANNFRVYWMRLAKIAEAGLEKTS